MGRPRQASEQPLLVEAPGGPGFPTWQWERQCQAEGRWPVAGVDEAGRGPLAGPVVAAAVILPFGEPWPGLNDSKQLPAAERDRLAAEVRLRALAVGVGVASVPEIDALNILYASHLAMARALAELPVPACFALVDGLPVRGLPCPHLALPKGDSRSLSIAAASVIAKVTRDALMRRLGDEHAGYGFEQHKGYPTPQHLAALAERGPCPIHRRTFRPVAALLTTPPPEIAVLPLAEPAEQNRPHP